ncbi:MAG: CPBP family intramembrane metalloprotease [Clostridia bacterium]|nr:CPBP family intramembrane metalloprotease [Clostridia bacterium]
MNKYLELGLFLAATACFSAFWGLSVEKMASGRIVSRLALRLMGFIRAPLDKIRFFVIWFAYILIGLLGTAACCVIFGISFCPSLFFGWDTLLFTVAGFILQLEISSVILLICSVFKSDTNWYRIISEINWVKVSFNLPRKIRVLYPTSSALFEELFFRCSVFLVLVTHFNWVPLPVSMLIVTFLFIIEQVVCTQKFKQAVAISAGAVAISLAGCLMIAVTGSILPAIICHELYVVFYLKK